MLKAKSMKRRRCSVMNYEGSTNHISGSRKMSLYFMKGFAKYTTKIAKYMMKILKVEKRVLLNT